MSRRNLWSRTTTAAAVVTVPVVVAVLAVVHPGFPLARLALNDGAVWLTATSQLKLGRFNVQVEELNAGLVTAGSTFDVLQDGGDVLLVEPGTVSVVDPAGVSLTTQVAAPGTTASMAGGTVALVDRDGAAWVRGIGQLESLRVAQDPADLDLGEGGAVVVARSGAAFGVSPQDGQVTRVDVSDGAAHARSVGSLGAGVVDQLTAVGDEPVVLSGSTLRTLHGDVELDGQDLRLQQAGPTSSRVLVASRTALLEVPLDGGRVVEHPTGGDGPPAAPVQVGRCAHGAWASGRGSYLQLCDGADPQARDLQGLSASDVLVFRVNRQQVVLNDAVRGRLWMPTQDGDLRVPNWQDIVPQEDPEQSDEDSDSPDTTQQLVTECSQGSGAPSAADDEFGVRPGRTTLLPVIDNDSSSDCGILAISEFDPVPPEFGHVEAVYGGRALQVTVADGAGGSTELTYTITDGRGTSAPSTAKVRLTVSPGDEQSPPVQLRTSTVQVEQGGQVERDALSDFADPDGDDLLLVGASADPAAGSVRFRPDGSVTFTADGGALGRTRVSLRVSDGTSVVDGTFEVEVRPTGSLPPRIDPVHAVTYVNQPVTLHPLDAVRSVSGEPARLASVEDVVGGTVGPDLAAGTFTFQAARAGSYYVPFVVAAPPQQATGLARIDVKEWPEQAEPPVAVRDKAFLPPGGEVVVDPLDNDSDPTGKVLVLLSVDAPETSGLRVAILDHHLVQVRALRTPERPVALRYVVSNGAAQAVGEIVVHPVPPSATSQPPVVKDVEVSVRTGGVVTIPVLDSATDPDGDRLALVRELPEPLGPGEGLLFVSGDVLRYQAPADPLTAHATFAVRDATGNETAARLTVRVHSSDASTKAPPRPRDLVARVFGGDSVRIDVPLVGIDPDGDGVTLLGVAQAPTRGRVTTVGADALLYESLPGESGTDTFTYAVEDWTGQRAVATIRVGIAPRPGAAASVVARDDAVTLSPGQTVEVRVLANDVDSSGGELQLAPEIEVPPGTEAGVVGRRISVRAPQEPTVVQIVYTALNARGGRDSGILTVTVTDDAPVEPPIARDVVVPPADTLGRTDVAVDVLAVAQNPSGPLSDLTVSVPAAVADVAQVTPDGHVLVTLVDHTQTLPYLLTNSTAPPGAGAASYAFITVPALGFFPPTLRRGAPALRVASGEQLVVPLDEQVKVAPGKRASVRDPLAVTATRSDGSNLVQDAHTLQFTSAPGYAGPASISLEVTDAAGSGDVSAHAAFITLPIEVYAVEDHPPTFAPSTIDVAPGETATSVDLRAFTTGPDGATATKDRYTYQVAAATPDGFVVELTDGVLRVAAGERTPKGRTGQVKLRVGYGRSGSLDATVDLRTIASIRAVARVDDQSAVGVEGRETTFEVLSHAWNPFPDAALTVLGATVETPGAGTAATDGSTVSVRPAVGFIGQMVTRIRVRDVTGDPDREVEARMVVVVRGRPATPAAPKVVEVRDRTVVLSWDAPDNRGAEITGYRVVVSPGGAVRPCASTTCTIDNLTNDTEYTFAVAAQNAVDWSEPSAPSAPARPDAVPDRPAAPTVEFGDQRVTATWSAPASAGSPVTRYELELSPAPPSGPAVVSTTATRYDFTGLPNGTAYSVRVRAYNRSVDPSAWSDSSQPVAPARAPDAPGVTASPTDSQAGSVLDISWTVPASNGDPVAGYELTVDGPGGVTVHLAAGQQQYTFTGATTKSPYTVSVRARNKAGLGDAGVVQASTFGLPGAPTTLTADARPGEGSVDLRWSGADDNGTAITGYVVSVSPGGRSVAVGAAEQTTVTGLDGGTSYSFTVQSVNAAGTSAGASPARTATATTPPAQAATVTLDDAVVDADGRPTRVTARWAPPATWGGGTGESYAYRFVVDGAVQEWQTTSATSADFTQVPSLDLSRPSFALTVEVRSRTSVCRPDGPVSCPAAATATRTYSRVTEPGTPQGLTFDQPQDGAASVTARWARPAADGGTPELSYEYEYTYLYEPDDVQTCATQGGLPTDGRSGEPGPGTTATVPVDTSCGPVNVRLRVRALSSYGEPGAWTDVVTVVARPAPEPAPGP